MRSLSTKMSSVYSRGKVLICSLILVSSIKKLYRVNECPSKTRLWCYSRTRVILNCAWWMSQVVEAQIHLVTAMSVCQMSSTSSALRVELSSSSQQWFSNKEWHSMKFKLKDKKLTGASLEGKQLIQWIKTWTKSSKSKNGRLWD